MKKNLYFFAIFLLFIEFEFILSDAKTTKFSLDEMLTGKIDSDESFDFYELSLPKNIEDGNLLVFTARENKMGFNPEDFLFSDPDIYIYLKLIKTQKIEKIVIGTAKHLEMILLQSLQKIW